MNKKMEKIQAMLDTFERIHGTVSVSEAETMNDWNCTCGCSECGGGCSAVCRSSCYNSCRSTYSN